MMTIEKKQKIYVDGFDNDRWFGQNLPTYRDGFCYITRTVHNIEDVNGVTEGIIKRKGNDRCDLAVIKISDEWHIEGEA